MNYKILFVLPLLAIFNNCATMPQVFIKNEVTTNKEAIEKKESDNRVRIFGPYIYDPNIYKYPNYKPGDCCLHLLPPKPSK
jgi:hypothetical protein